MAGRLYRFGDGCIFFLMAGRMQRSTYCTQTIYTLGVGFSGRNESEYTIIIIWWTDSGKGNEHNTGMQWTTLDYPYIFCVDDTRDFTANPRGNSKIMVMEWTTDDRRWLNYFPIWFLIKMLPNPRADVRWADRIVEINGLRALLESRVNLEICM